MTGARTVIRDDPGDSPGYTLVVAVSNPDTVDQLMRTAVDLASANNGEIVAVSVVHKPLTSPFLLFSADRIRETYHGDHSVALERATIFGSGARVPVRRHLLVGSDVSEAILQATHSADGDALLLGWQDRIHPSDVVLGRTVDRVVARARCPVYVERVGTTAGEVDSILLPTIGGPHLAAIADLVAAVARANDASVTVASFTPPDAGPEARESAHDAVEAAADSLDGVTCERVVEPAGDVGSAIVSAAAEHDLVVLGATRERGLTRRVVGSVAERVASEAEPPVVIARRRIEPSVFDRLIGR